MNVTRISPLTQQPTTLDLPITAAQLAELEGPRESRRLVQDIFPDLTKAQREFLMTGYTEADWAELFPLVSGLVYIGKGNVYHALSDAHAGPFLISCGLDADGTFPLAMSDWVEVEDGAEPHAEIMAAKAALGIRTTLGEILGDPLSDQSRDGDPNSERSIG